MFYFRMEKSETLNFTIFFFLLIFLTFEVTLVVGIEEVHNVKLQVSVLPYTSIFKKARQF